MSTPLSHPADAIASLDMVTLSAAYRSAALTPTQVAKAVLARIDAAGDDHVWICKVPPGNVLARAAELEAMGPAERARLPLWGIPFAVKDNIDVAGMPTTAACPGFAFTPGEHAAVVARLLDAGAMLVGKTNLDQFATGLVGVRSPYGTPRNAINADYVPGGSSSGSCVAVGAGLVSFALGTDTAGSGRVPAAFNNIVGLKPTKGLVSTRGVVPACRSVDCVSVQALTVEDAMDVLEVLSGFDPADGFSRVRPPVAPALPPKFRFGVPRDEQLRFFGDTQAEALYRQSLDRLVALGGERVTIDFDPFYRVAELLYGGPWVAERTAAVGDFIAADPDKAHPVVRDIILGGRGKSAVDTFRAMYEVEEIGNRTLATWNEIDILALPTAGTIYKVAEVLADPVRTNSNLGAYTNFVNLLDLCAIAVPGGFRPDGLPFGITLMAPAFREAALAPLAARLHRAAGVGMGAGTVTPPEGQSVSRPGAQGLLPLLVVGGHLAGYPLNPQLTDRGARLVETVHTAPCYRFFALPGEPARPGLVRVADGGVAVEGEIWELTPADFGMFVAAIPAPLGVGQVELSDGRKVTGFLCEAVGVEGAEDISAYGGWRAWQTRR